MKPFMMANTLYISKTETTSQDISIYTVQLSTASHLCGSDSFETPVQHFLCISRSDKLQKTIMRNIYMNEKGLVE